VRNTRVVALMTMLTAAAALARSDSGGLLRAGLEAMSEEDSRELARFEDWRKKIDAARSRRSVGRTLMLSGGGVSFASALVGGALAMKRAQNCNDRFMAASQPPMQSYFAPAVFPAPQILAPPSLTCGKATSGPMMFTAVGGAAGVGLMVLGAIRQHGAHEDLGALHAEGRAKGYLSIGSIPGGVVGVYTLRF
jgi:hypothetical protein